MSSLTTLIASSRHARYCAVLCLSGLAACGNDASDSNAVASHALEVAEPGIIAASPQRDGDPIRGREALLQEAYVECGLPARLFREGQGVLPAGQQVARDGAGRDLPYFLNSTVNDDGVELAVNNCLTCHGAPLFGELVIGLGNEFADFTEDPSIAVERAGLLLRSDEEIAAWERYADRIAAIAPHIQMQTVGSNPANNLTFALIAHRDPITQAWSDTPLLSLPSTEPPPVSVPPWWRMKKKHAMFNLGEGRGDHARLMMSASMMCTDNRKDLAAIDEYAADVRAFITSLEAPEWPFDSDADQAAIGQQLFDQNCSQCHGTYGETVTYPNRLVDIDVVGTDATLMEQALTEGGPWIDWLNRSYYGELSQALPGRGYVAPPLDGIWATGPYLHNGSVPTLLEVLDSGSRPEIWVSVARDANDKAGFDRSRVGWLYKSLDAGQVSELEPGEQKYVYDTRKRGHGNAGHTFGDHLDDSQRLAVIEYLKTL